MAGRTRKHSSDADKQRAYRERKARENRNAQALRMTRTEVEIKGCQHEQSKAPEQQA